MNLAFRTPNGLTTQLGQLTQKQGNGSANLNAWHESIILKFEINYTLLRAEISFLHQDIIALTIRRADVIEVLYNFVRIFQCYWKRLREARILGGIK